MIRLSLKVALSLLVAAAGCGSSEGNLDQGGKLDRGGALDGTGVRERGAVSDGAAAGPIEVIYETKSYPVDLAKVAPVTLDGVEYARLSDMVLQVLPGKSLDTLTVDFEAADGFKPATSPSGACKTLIPVPGANLSKGYVQLQSHNLRWDDSLAYPGCLTIKRLAKIFLANK